MSTIKEQLEKLKEDLEEIIEGLGEQESSGNGEVPPDPPGGPPPKE